MNFGWELEQKAWDFGDKIAIINPDESKINYRDLNNLSNRMGNVLKKQGIKRGDVVSTLLPDGYEYLAFIVGAWKIGAIAAPLNRAAEFKRWAEMLSATDSKLLIANIKFSDAAEKLLNETSLNKVILQGGRKTGCDHIEELLQDASPELKIVPCRSSDPANITFTGGTTGISKAVISTHGMLQYTSRKCQMLLGTCSKDTALMPIATYHTGGLSMLCIGIVSASTHILLGDWSTDRFVYLMKKYKPNYVYIWPPIMARDVMTHKEFPDLDLKGFKTIFSGDVTHPDIQKAYREKGARTCDGYGMTEVVTYMIATPSMYYGEDMEAPYGGKVVLEDVGDLKLVDPSTGEEIKKPNERGEIWFKGDRHHVLTPGYFKMPLETSKSIDSEGWFHTKDLGYRDERGYLFVGGRSDDIINVGAEKLSLVEVEQVLFKHPKIKDCALIGIAHERYSTVPAAFIVSTESIDDKEAFKNELDEFVIKNLMRWKRPRLYIFIDEIPRIAAKKTKKIGELKKYVENIILKSDSGIQMMVDEKRN